MPRRCRYPPWSYRGKAELCQPEVTLTSRPHVYRRQMHHLITKNLCWRIRMSNQSSTELAGGRKGHVEVTSWQSVPSTKVITAET